MKIDFNFNYIDSFVVNCCRIATPKTLRSACATNLISLRHRCATYRQWHVKQKIRKSTWWLRWKKFVFFIDFLEFDFFFIFSFFLIFFFVKAVNSVMALPGVRANKTKLLFKLKTAHDIFFLDQVCLLLFSFNHFKFIEIDAQIKGVGSVSWCDFESIAINIVDSYRTSGTVAKTSKLLWIYLIFTNIFNIDWCNVCRWQHVAMR